MNYNFIHPGLIVGSCLQELWFRPMDQFKQLSLQQEEPIQAAPASSKSMRFPLRPGKGSTGTRCIVKANHFFAELPHKDLHQYDVKLWKLSNLSMLHAEVYYVLAQQHLCV